LFSMADGDNVIGMTIVMDDDADVVDADADADVVDTDADAE
jgi:hypothetical protein